MPPYNALAPIYDAVMDHVDYDAWAEHVHRLLQRHAPDRAPVRRLLEIGGGTGQLALRLQPMGEYDYVLTDGAPAMLSQARSKIDVAALPIRTAVVRFETLSAEMAELDGPADAVVCVYDGLNYLLDLDAVADLFTRVHDVLRPGGLFVFDQSTPANSEDHADAFTDTGRGDGYAYVRESRYNPATHRHVTTFEVQRGGRTVRETHVQRAYSIATVRDALNASPLEVVAAYDGFSTEPVRPRSHRVHWVACRPQA